MINRLQLILLVLFACMGTQAQTVTEKGLAGTWKLSTATMHGMLLNFETGKASVLPGYEDKYTADDLKKVERGIAAEHPFPKMVTFKEGGIMTVAVDSQTVDSHYTLTDKNGSSYIKDEADEYQVRITGAILSFIYVAEEGGTIEISFKKQ